jgi:hypothetical protein
VIEPITIPRTAKRARPSAPVLYSCDWTESARPIGRAAPGSKWRKIEPSFPLVKGTRPARSSDVCEKTMVPIAGPRVRIHLPPPVSLQTPVPPERTSRDRFRSAQRRRAHALLRHGNGSTVTFPTERPAQTGSIISTLPPACLTPCSHRSGEPGFYLRKLFFQGRSCSIQFSCIDGSKPLFGSV